MMNSFLPMRDEAAIPRFDRTVQEDGTVCYFFGDTTIRVIEKQTAENIRLIPVSGDQAACGEWVELDKEQVCRYCDLLAQHLNSGAGTRSKTTAETAKGVQEDQRLCGGFERACKKIMKEDA